MSIILLNIKKGVLTAPWFVHYGWDIMYQSCTSHGWRIQNDGHSTVNVNPKIPKQSLLWASLLAWSDKVVSSQWLRNHWYQLQNSKYQCLKSKGGKHSLKFLQKRDSGLHSTAITVLVPPKDKVDVNRDMYMHIQYISQTKLSTAKAKGEVHQRLNTLQKLKAKLNKIFRSNYWIFILIFFKFFRIMLLACPCHKTSCIFSTSFSHADDMTYQFHLAMSCWICLISYILELQSDGYRNGKKIDR